MRKAICFVFIFLLQSFFLNAGEPVLRIQKNTPVIYLNERSHLFAPKEGLWSVATSWESEWPAAWRHANPLDYKLSGDWQVFFGEMEFPQGLLKLQDAYLNEGNRIKCVRRFEWLGEEQQSPVRCKNVFHSFSVICTGIYKKN